jgi:hypothetical protein
MVRCKADRRLMAARYVSSFVRNACIGRAMQCDLNCLQTFERLMSTRGDSCKSGTILASYDSGTDAMDVAFLERGRACECGASAFHLQFAVLWEFLCALPHSFSEFRCLP